MNESQRAFTWDSVAAQRLIDVDGDSLYLVSHLDRGRRGGFKIPGSDPAAVALVNT